MTKIIVFARAHGLSSSHFECTFNRVWFVGAYLAYLLYACLASVGYFFQFVAYARVICVIRLPFTPQQTTAIHNESTVLK